MQLPLFAFATLFVQCLQPAQSLSLAMSPVSRIVELLESISKKIEEEAHTEEGLYKKYVCWATSNIDAKTASNTAAKSRIDSLNTYVADLDAGRIELTTERVDLEKELAQINGDLETAKNLRDTERAQFESAKGEMEQAIAALTEAIRVLSDATSGSLLAVKQKVQTSAGFAARVAEAALLQQAVALANRSLSRADAYFLQRVLIGEVPTIDWEKLNRKADFKMKYEARSSEIQAVLAKLEKTFEKNLAEAISKEENEVALYEKLTGSKNDQKTATETALLKMEIETGARGMSKADAVAEIEALSQQMTDDTKYIGELKTALDTKKTEWSARVDLRTKEVAAIFQAIAILHSDEARDTFKKSFTSQGYLFLQVIRRSSRVSAAVAELRQLSQSAGHAHATRLSALASRVAAMAASGGQFDAVLSAIDTMVGLLQKEENDDLQRKEQCEEDRATDTRLALIASRSIDEMTDKIGSLEADIEALNKEIGEKNTEIADINVQMEKATRMRQDENKAYTISRTDDTDAVALLKQAREVLENFYAANGLSLSQHSKQAPGLAPPPPPSTWEGSYGGKTGESAGIISILSLVQDDIEKDIKSADAAEAFANSEYEKLKRDSTQEISDLNSLISTLEGTKSTKESDVQSTQTEQTTKKGELESTLVKLKAAAPGCDFIAVNFALRSSNRQVEIDGLQKAKAILQGAKFEEQPPVMLVSKESLANVRKIG